MGQWEPLPDRVPVDMRRLATQLRRMKDRSGLTVPALAARTAQPVEAWERAFAARQLPPLDAVEVLAQASGADYDRTRALWKLAERTGHGSGDRGRGKPVPRPDPLDPLGPEEGLPGGRRRFWLLSGVAALAVAALVAVLLTAGISTGRAPGGGDAGPTATGAAVPERFGSSVSPNRGTPPRGATPGRGPGGSGPASVAPGAPGDQPSPAMESTSPGVTPTGGGSLPGASGTPSAPGAGASGGGSGGGHGATPTVSAPPPSSGAPSPAPSATPTRRQLCLGLIVLGVCVG